MRKVDRDYQGLLPMRPDNGVALTGWLWLEQRCGSCFPGQAVASDWQLRLKRTCGFLHIIEIEVQNLC